ncbi:MAG: phosphoribosyltransferase [Gammaproteobacteria bacterium]
MDKYLDRTEAGKILAEHLKAYANRADAIVLALPRGGVPVAYEIAQALNLPLDVYIVRKLGVPGHEELAMGALAMGGVTVFNEDIVRDLSIPKAMIDKVIKKEQDELSRRELAYRDNLPFPKLANKTVILVDDGIATGATIRAAVMALRQLNPASIVIAVPVAEKSTCEKMEKIADKVVCPLRPSLFYAVGAWYDHFDQTEDEEVHQLLKKYRPE